MKARIASGLAVALALGWMAEPSCRPAAQHDPIAAEASAPLGEAAAKILVHGFFDAHDAADEPGLAAMLATAFTYVDDGRPINRDDVISEVRARQSSQPTSPATMPAMTAKWMTRWPPEMRRSKGRGQDGLQRRVGQERDADNKRRVSSVSPGPRKRFSIWRRGPSRGVGRRRPARRPASAARPKRDRPVRECR